MMFYSAIVHLYAESFEIQTHYLLNQSLDSYYYINQLGNNFIFPVAQQPLLGQGLVIIEASRSQTHHIR
jgi:hypothetical protein